MTETETRADIAFAEQQAKQERDDWQARIAALAKLRESFRPEAVGKLPRVTCKACRDSSSKSCEKHNKSECLTCGNWITSAHMHLDYVGHAEVTDRLLSVDPEWSWEPMATDDVGLPVIRKGASGEWELWIRLTVQGVTRIGVGSVSTGFDAEKQLIGDALRNAAMRFGVALDLWSKAELESAADDTPIAGPPKAASPNDVIRTRVAGLPSEIEALFRPWLDAERISRQPAEWTDETRALILAWLHRAEHGEIRPPDATTAKSSDPTPETRPTDPEPAPESLSLPIAEPDTDRLVAAKTAVAGMDSVTILASLTAYEITPQRRTTERADQLVAAMVADNTWVPA